MRLTAAQDRVMIHRAGQAIEGWVILASGNRRSLMLGFSGRLGRYLSPDWMLRALRARVLDWIDHLNARRGGGAR